MIKLIAYLGNFGKEYSETRHNTAWLFESSLPFSSKINWQNKFKSEFFSIDRSNFIEWLFEHHLIEKDTHIPSSISESKIYFLKPLTYMNLSGEAVGDAAKFYKLTPDEILVVHDEIELPLGTVSLKCGGGLAGHNGLRSIKERLSSAEFWRLRFGIGKPTHGSVADFVLSSFSSDEKITLSQTFLQASSLFAKIITLKDPSTLLGEWSKKKVIPETN